MKLHGVLFLAMLCLNSIAIAQVKYEKEARIPTHDLPLTVQVLLPQLTQDAKRIRYYHEFDGEKESFEVKLKKHGTHFSIEFSQDGVLEDIEMLIPASELPNPILETIGKQFQRHKLTRIQKQFTHPKGQDPKQTLQGVFNGLIRPTAYEIVVNGKTNSGYKQVEFLIDIDGKLLKKRNVITKDYEHVVY